MTFLHKIDTRLSDINSKIDLWFGNKNLTNIK